MSLHTNTNPFVGLRPFESDESLLFFGRQEQTVELLQRLHKHHFVAIIGNSGCGKSSLIRAGLIPRLKAGYLLDGQDKWMIAMMKPGQSPIHNLAEAILEQMKGEPEIPDGPALVQKIIEEGAEAILEIVKPLWEQRSINFFLLVDQFEELFRFSMNEGDADKKDEAIDFVNIILTLSRQIDLPVYIVMTMRSDFIGDCAQFYGLPEAMNESQYLVPRLNRGNLRNAIVGPVKLYGSIIDPALTSRLLNDAASLKDELPLLQHALMRIWDHEIGFDKSGKLDLSDYEKIGGIERALSIHADEALEGMSEEELALTKKIFQSLTIIDENGRKTRHPVLMSELVALTGETREKLMDIIKRFSEEKKSFLIVTKVGDTKEELIDISHESLIRQWARLIAWSDEEANSAKNYLHLKESAELFRKKEKDLLEGSEFQIAMQWFKTFKPSPVWAQRYGDGLNESAEYLRESEKQQKVNEVRKKSGIRNRRILIFLSVLFLLITVIFYIAKQRLQTIKEAFALNSLAQEQAIGDPTVGLRIGEAAYDRYNDSTIRAVSDKIYRDNAFYKTLIRDSFAMPSIAISDSLILSGSKGGNAKLWNMQGHKLVEFKGATDAVAISSEARKIVTSSAGNMAVVWDFNGNKLAELIGHDGEIKALAFSPDGTKVLSGSTDNTAILWNLTGQQLHRYSYHQRTVRAVAFSADGNQILTGSEDKTAALWGINDQKPSHVYTGHHDVVGSVAISHDGKKILTGSHDNKAMLWDINGEMIKEYTGHTGVVISARFSPGDESRILTASYDGKVRLWSVHEGDVLKEFRGNTGKFYAAAFMADGNRIITSGEDPENSIRLWSLGKNFSKEFTGHTDSVLCVAFSPEGRRIFTGSADGTGRLWDLDDSSSISFKGINGRINAVAFSPNGSRVVICSRNAAELRNLDSGTTRTLTGHQDMINSVDFSPRGDKILTASSDGTARLWFYSDGSAFGRPIKGSAGPVLSAVFSADGNKILLAFLDETIAECNMDGSGMLTIKEGTSKAALSSVAFSPDRKRVAFGFKDGRLEITPIASGDDNDDDAHPLTIDAHEDGILSIAFSPDGTRILTGSEDHVIKVWDLQGVCLSTLTGHGDCVLSVAFSPDGKKMISGSEDKNARLWTDMPLSEFLNSDLLDKLTEAQKKKFGIRK